MNERELQEIAAAFCPSPGVVREPSHGVPALVAEVRRLTAALATARREGAEAVRDAVMGYLDEIFPGGPAATDARWPHELMEHVACAVAQAMREGGE